MRKILLFLLLVLPIYLVISIYFLDKDYFLCPLEYKSGILVRSDSRGNGFFASPRNGNRAHRGVDLFAPVGTPVFAARSGIVTVASEERLGMGKYVLVRHPGNIATLYGHLSRISVSKNQFVRQGDVIAKTGKTGNANYQAIQPHLHFEVRKNEIPQDPLEYLQ